MADRYVSTNSVGCATPSKPSKYHYKTLKELFDGVGKNDFEFFGDRYLRFLEVYDTIKPKWRYALWGNIKSVDHTFLMIDNYPAIAKAMGQSIIFHVKQEKFMEAQLQLGELLGQQRELDNEMNPKKMAPLNHYIK